MEISFFQEIILMEDLKMNTCILSGRLSDYPTLSENAEKTSKVARYHLAVESEHANAAGERQVSFLSCVAFGAAADFAAKYLEKGDKVLVKGSVKSNDYTNKEGVKVYGIDFVISSHEFLETKEEKERRKARSTVQASANGQQGYQQPGAPVSQPIYQQAAYQQPVYQQTTVPVPQPAYQQSVVPASQPIYQPTPQTVNTPVQPIEAAPQPMAPIAPIVPGEGLNVPDFMVEGLPFN